MCWSKDRFRGGVNKITKAIVRGFVLDIEAIRVKNSEFRRILCMAKHCPLVVMALKLQEETGRETS